MTAFSCRTELHIAKAVVNNVHSHNVEVLEWSGNSPVMNPVGNSWKEIKDSVRITFSSTKQQLNERLIQVWHHDQNLIQLVQREVESMPQHIQALDKAEGGPTKYYDIYFVCEYMYLLFKNNFLHIRSYQSV
jgi:hypothetical protein